MVSHLLALPLTAPREHLLHNAPNRQTPFRFEGQQPSSAEGNRVALGCKTPLAQLRADENLIAQRKHNVRRFGAGWLRPPGVAKTLQSKLEEAQEQMDQQEMQRRDAEIRAQEEAAQQAAGDGPLALGGQELPDQEERDLDADVPDAEETGMTSDEELEHSANITFNEASLLESSPGGGGRDALATEDAELDGRLQEARDLGMAGDLDDDIPEAGSYEHTDTELEDLSSDEGNRSGENDVAFPSVQRRSDGRGRTSLLSENSEMPGSSSFMESSPALSRRGHLLRSSQPVRRGRS